jgi:hypothetical protein
MTAATGLMSSFSPLASQERKSMPVKQPFNSSPGTAGLLSLRRFP